MKALTKDLAATAVWLSAIALTPAPVARRKQVPVRAGRNLHHERDGLGPPLLGAGLQGFKQAAEAMGCETVFSGTPDYDITKQIASFEQDLVKKPAGILLHPMQSDPFIEPINRAIDSGVAVVTFAADSPKSKRTAYITSDNLAEAKFAAEEIVKQVGDKGEYAVLENPGQSNHDLRVTAFIAYMEKNYPEHEAGRPPGDQPGQQRRLPGDVASMLQANPNLGAMWIPEAGSAEGAVAAVLEAKAKVSSCTPTSRRRRWSTSRRATSTWR